MFKIYLPLHFLKSLVLNLSLHFMKTPVSNCWKVLFTIYLILQLLYSSNMFLICFKSVNMHVFRYCNPFVTGFLLPLSNSVFRNSTQKRRSNINLFAQLQISKFFVGIFKAFDIVFAFLFQLFSLTEKRKMLIFLLAYIFHVSVVILSDLEISKAHCY